MHTIRHIWKKKKLKKRSGSNLRNAYKKEALTYIAETSSESFGMHHAFDMHLKFNTCYKFLYIFTKRIFSENLGEKNLPTNSRQTSSNKSDLKTIGPMIYFF